jgi:hypothetical protein
MIAAQAQRTTRGSNQRGDRMTLVIGYHEIDDSAHWLASPKREEVFGPLGITVRTFLDPENPNRAAVLADVPDMAAFQAVMQSQAGADAMAYDGVRADTFVLLVEA